MNYADPAMIGSGHDRLDLDTYDTIEADKIVPALLRGFPVRGPVLEPAAGRGLMVEALRAARLSVVGFDVEPRAEGIHTADLLTLNARAAAPFGSVVTNLPYDHQDRLLAHLLDITAGTGSVSILTRLEWSAAKARGDLVRRHPRYAGQITLTRRPRWIEGSTGYPRHYYCWQCWHADPRPPGADPFIKYEAI